MIIDTHLDHGEHAHRLSDCVTQGDGYEGRLYREPGALTSSWENKKSFWPTLASFHKMLSRSGYSTVLTVEPWVTGPSSSPCPDPPRQASADPRASRP